MTIIIVCIAAFVVACIIAYTLVNNMLAGSRNKGFTGSRYKFRSRSDRDNGEEFTKQYKVTLKAE